ncbi:MAG: pyrroline-5-carboxylate reductase [Dehalococcoidia bacterium]
MRLTIIGGGVMGEAILSAALARGVYGPSDVTVCELVETRRNALHARYGVHTTPESGDAMRSADVVILSVKPQEVGSVQGRLRPDALLVSIMAGVGLAQLRAEFEHTRIVRVMPNTPAAVNAGMSAWTATPEVDDQQRELTRGLLAAIGREAYVDSEKKVDMATAVSGSGPAYVFLVMEALIEGAVSVGLPRAQAEELVLQTVLGAAQYAQETGMKPAELRAMVTSPAGTTAAGLLELEKGAVRASFIECVRAAYKRAVELGQPS